MASKDEALRVGRRRLMAGDREVRLSPLEELIMWCLVARSPQPTSTKDLVYFCYGEDEDGGPNGAARCVHSTICKLRPKVLSLGWRILTRWHEGYWLARLGSGAVGRPPHRRL